MSPKVDEDGVESASPAAGIAMPAIEPRGFPLELLKNLCHLRSGFPFKSSSWLESGTAVVQIGNVKDGYLDLASVKHVDAVTAATALSPDPPVSSRVVA